MTTGRIVREAPTKHRCRPPDPFGSNDNWIVQPGHPPRLRDGVRLPKVGDVWECDECGERSVLRAGATRGGGYASASWVNEGGWPRFRRRVDARMGRAWDATKDVTNAIGLLLLAAVMAMLALYLFLAPIVSGWAGDDAADTVTIDTADPEGAEAEAHDVLADRLRAMIDNDWAHVYDLTTDAARPNDRTMWTDRDEFVHKCTGDPTRRPTIDLLTLDHGDGVLVVQSTVWVQSDQATTCHWLVEDTPTGWRVGEYIARASDNG